MALLALLSVAGGLLGAHVAGEPLFRFLEGLTGSSAAGAGPVPHPPAALLMAVSVAVALAGIAAGAIVHRGRRDPTLGPIGAFLEQGWYLDALYNRVIVGPGHALARWLAGPVDIGIIDGAVNGVARATDALGIRTRGLQTGYARHYALGVLIGTVIILGFWILR
jgi:NADH-quinone oxidoreductase subunit L